MKKKLLLAFVIGVGLLLLGLRFIPAWRRGVDGLRLDYSNDEGAAAIADRLGRGEPDPGDIPLLRRLLASPHPKTKRAAIAAAGRFGTMAQVRHEIRKLIRDPDPDIRRHAIEVIPRFGNLAGNYVADLYGQWKQEALPDIRTAIAFALDASGASAQTTFFPMIIAAREAQGEERAAARYWISFVGAGIQPELLEGLKLQITTSRTLQPEVEKIKKIALADATEIVNKKLKGTG